MIESTQQATCWQNMSVRYPRRHRPMNTDSFSSHTANHMGLLMWNALVFLTPNRATGPPDRDSMPHVSLNSTNSTDRWLSTTL